LLEQKTAATCEPRVQEEEEEEEDDDDDDEC
jgi:hypothetical protein